MADSKLTASAGEHYVCAELARRGWAASLTRDGLARTDILAVNAESRAMIEVQVKTAHLIPTWPMGANGIVPSKTDREWFVFVLLGELPVQPRCWILPRDHVVAGTWITHMAWLTSPDAKRPRNTAITNARISEGAWERYEDMWDLLLMPTDMAPVLLPNWMREKVADEEVGLPSDHRWRDDLPAWTGGAVISTASP